MALPREYLTDKMIELNKRISKMSPTELGALPPLTPEDNEMVGMFIQNFNFIDLNLRRALEIFEIGKILPTHARKTYPDIQDSKLAGIAIEVIAVMNPSVEDVSNAKERLTEIDYGRRVRNLLGHFAAKRFPGEEVFVFASKSARDARKALGRNLAHHHVQTAVAGRLEIRALTFRLSEHSLWLANRIPVWDERYLGT
jgi:hypothetical protein